MDELGSFPAKISVRARMTLYCDFRNSYPWGKECFDLTVKYLKRKINLKKQSEVYNERGNASFGYMRLFLILVSMQRSPWILLCPFPVYLDSTRQRAIILSKIVHPYLIPNVRETKQNYMATLKPYTDEVKDTIIDALKANLKVENEEDEILGENNSNQPCENSVSTVNEDYIAPTVDKDGVAFDVDEILPLAIVDEDLVVVDERDKGRRERTKGAKEEKMEEKKQEKERIEEKEEQKEEKLEEKKEEENKREEIEEEKEEEKKEEDQEKEEEK
ncbi:hypothetical protein H5410_022411 [Solanum commersonii]|uniref:Uncharacterized protein n=1 Tax=Solanum commersonii TaxID=4109 RepID=A0A9J5ZEP9_SOLCO|nr:hypothetical protein H5410_022411 [Solanum commersonii]